ncbi:MAG: PDDEXK nuclease domain-containing protein [Bacteroidia bacterium]
MTTKTNKTKPLANNTDLFKTVVALIEKSRQKVVSVANVEMVLLYWNVGKVIGKNILNNKRAGYGDKIIANLAIKLNRNYGTGWSKRQLWNCVRSADTFTYSQVVSAAQAQLSWTHVKTIMFLDHELQREFYLQLCGTERWNTRQLEERIDSMLFERTAISKKPEKLIKLELSKIKREKNPTPDLIFRDPYILDFLGLTDTYSEKDLESAIVAEMQRFIIELGSDFAFMGRQKRIVIDNEDYFMDLLFFHRSLRRLVVIDLKLGKFKPKDKAQMELYLNWLEKNMRKPMEEPPIGLILCAGKSDEHIEYLMLNKGNIRVAQYLTGLPTKNVLQQKLHRAIKVAQTKLAKRESMTADSKKSARSRKLITR